MSPSQRNEHWQRSFAFFSCAATTATACLHGPAQPEASMYQYCGYRASAGDSQMHTAPPASASSGAEPKRNEKRSRRRWREFSSLTQKQNGVWTPAISHRRVVVLSTIFYGLRRLVEAGLHVPRRAGWPENMKKKETWLVGRGRIVRWCCSRLGG